MKMKKKLIFKIFNFWPPYLGAGIKVKHYDFTENVIKVEMNLSRLNSNYVGTHFGGSLYSMCDPFYMLILMEKLGSDFIVWDKSASIDFVRPGKGKVKATFHIPQSEIDDIKSSLKVNEKIYPEFLVEVIDEAGEVVAKVNKVLYVKRKR